MKRRCQARRWGVVLTLLWISILGPGKAAAQDQLCQVHIATQPVGATVRLDGSTRGITPLTITAITPGTHLFVLKKDGYHEERRTLKLSPEERAAIDLKMDVIVGLVLVKAQPEGATILINGAERGKSPLLVTDLPMGQYRVRIEAPNHIAKEVELNIKDRLPIKIDTVLLANTATVQMNSDPTGARVLLNGLDKGVTPLMIEDIPTGEVTLSISMDGFETYTQKVSLESGQFEAMKAVLTPLPATLSVSSIPSGARIYLDGKLRGNAPLWIAPMAPGSYKVRAELTGFENLTKNIQVEQAQNAIEEFRLWSNSGLLEVVTEPAGVRVFIEGQQHGVTDAATNETDRVSQPLTVRLAEGQHVVQFTKQGFFESSRRVRVAIDQTTSVHETLDRRFIPNFEVITASGSIKGYLIEKLPNGDIRLEVSAGVRRTVPRREIKSAGPLRD
jgi:hypothetical protein